MAQDQELDRLRLTQDDAFQRQQHAWNEQDQAWKRCSTVKEAMHQAYELKQAAYNVQDAAWQDFHALRSSYGPRIDDLNAQQESAYQQMRQAFDQASAAHSSHDGAAARLYADEGHRYKTESQAAVAERRILIQEIRDARDRHEATRPAFQQAKAEYDLTRGVFDQATGEHERARAAFLRAKEEFAQAQIAVQQRLAALRAAHQQRQAENRSLAERAGVPYQYLDTVWVSTKPDGTVNLYFGGLGTPDGPGHGHYAMGASGELTYQREPFDPHGPHNFTDQQEGVLYDATVSQASVRGARGSYDFVERKGHVTQSYADNTRYSWDLDHSGSSNGHWTDQRVGKNQPGRHEPPTHAKR